MKLTLTKKAFTLVEILIIAAVIVTIAAIAIPIVISYRINANEGAAISNLRMLHGAIESYSAANKGAYPTSLCIHESELYNSNPRYLNDTTFGTCSWDHFPEMGGGTKQNYWYWYLRPTNPLWDSTITTSDYVLYAGPSEAVGAGTDPNVWRWRGRRTFRILSNGQIQWIWREGAVYPDSWTVPSNIHPLE